MFIIAKLQAKRLGHILYSYTRNKDVYYEMNNQHYQDTSVNMNRLKIIIATQNYNSLSHWILYGKMDDIAKQPKLMQQLVNLCRVNQWEKGLRLLNSAANRVSA